MREIFTTSLRQSLLLIVMFCFGFSVNAQSTDEPAISFHTNIYNTYGSGNAFSLVLGSTDVDCKFYIDCGFGKEELTVNPAYYDEAAGGLSGTFVSCTVSEEGMVRIYGDADKLDYLNASGCYIDHIDLTEARSLVILDLGHNELKDIDLSSQTQLQALYLGDNTFTKETPLVIPSTLKELSILEISIIEHMDPDFDLRNYPKMMSFDAYHNVSLTHIDPTQCPSLYRLTLDVTNVESVDVSQNPELMILNVSETKVTSIDVSHNPKLRELYCSHRGSFNNEYKLTSLDVTNNPDLIYLFCSGNLFTELDLSNNPGLLVLETSDNYLTSIDLSANTKLYQVYLTLNCMNFRTLPENPGTWNTYYYGQRDIVLDKSYPEGHTIDLGDKVLKEGTTTSVTFYAVNESIPEEPIKLSREYYDYKDGVVTLKKAYADSVYFSFENSYFDEHPLNTQKFLVKKASEYGQPTRVFHFTTGVEEGNEIAFKVGVAGASPENPVEFLVNFGDGTKETFTATSETTPATANVVGTRKGWGSIEVYAPEGVELTALDVRDISMYSADVTKLRSLRTLDIINAGLYTIDLTWNRCLTSLNLSGNNLSVATLEGVNAGYGKNVLTDVNLSNNQLSSITLHDLTILRNLDLSHNKLTEAINFYTGEYIKTIDLSDNLFTELDFTYCAELTDLNVAGCQLKSIILPEQSSLKHLDLSDNFFTIATLPEHGNLTEEGYIYAPQSDLQIATKGPCADLSGQQRSLNGAETLFVWKKTNSDILVEGTDYEVIDGITTFLDPNIGEVYCEMYHDAFPQFKGSRTFSTTIMEVAGMPTNVVATFHTINNGDIVDLSLAAADYGTAIYIDWNGNGAVTQYLLETTYKLFQAKTKADTEVKVYTYDPADKVTVFSMTGAELSSFDGSKLTDAINISVCGGNLTEISLPEGSTKLQELALENNALKRFELTPFPELRTLALTGNRLTSLDLTPCPKLELASAAYNALTDIVIDNSKLWALYIDHNSFESIDLSGCPNLQQFSISNNYLSEIEVDNLKKLKMLVINNNYFSFATLPLHKSSYITYYYHNQYPLDIEQVNGVVDLSDQSMVDGSPTLYYWFIGMPEVDEEGYLVGTLMTEGEDYTITDGVTSFHKDIDDAMCLMVNEKLPNVYIYTYMLDVKSGIDNVADAAITITSTQGSISINADQEGLPISICGINGIAILNAETQADGITVDNLSPGIYIVTVGDKTAKVIVR